MCFSSWRLEGRTWGNANKATIVKLNTIRIKKMKFMNKTSILFMLLLLSTTAFAGEWDECSDTYAVSNVVLFGVPRLSRNKKMAARAEKQTIGTFEEGSAIVIRRWKKPMMKKFFVFEQNGKQIDPTSVYSAFIENEEIKELLVDLPKRERRANKLSRAVMPSALLGGLVGCTPFAIGASVNWKKSILIWENAVNAYNKTL